MSARGLVRAATARLSDGSRLAGKQLGESVERCAGSLFDARRTVSGAVFVASAAATEVAALLDWRWLRNVAKPLIVPTLTLHTLAQGRVWAGDEKTLLAGSAALHTVGDVALLRDTDAQDPDRAARELTAGALAFGAGHLVGLALLSRLGVRARAATVVPAVSAAAGAFVLRRATGPGGPVHDAVFAGYAGVLTEYAARCVSALWAPGWDRDAARVIALGGALWLVSDGLIAVRLAAGDREWARRILSYGVMDSYAGAQLMVQSGLARQLDVVALASGRGVREDR